MMRHRILVLLALLAVGLGVAYANTASNSHREFTFYLRGDNTKQSGDHWVLTEPPDSAPLIYLEFRVHMGRHFSRGNTFPVIARQLVDGTFDFVKHNATKNDEVWHFGGGRSIRLFWSCEPLHETATRIHAVAIEYNYGDHVSTLHKTVTVTLAARAA